MSNRARRSAIVAAEREYNELAEAIKKLVDAAIEERIGRAILPNGRVNASAIAGIVPVGHGGSGTDHFVPPPPFVYLVDSDGAYLLDSDGKYLWEYV